MEHRTSPDGVPSGSPYKRPREWRWVDAIPCNALGKVLRHELTP
jgi:acyl-coenzyme A synthetase/AMP-(fatty) acid ligase